MIKIQNFLSCDRPAQSLQSTGNRPATGLCDQSRFPAGPSQAFPTGLLQTIWHYKLHSTWEGRKTIKTFSQFSKN